MVKIPKEDLKFVAEELNVVLGLEPEIQPNDYSEEQLIDLLKQAADLIVPEDVITPKTTNLLKVLLGEIELEEEEEKVPETKPEKQIKEKPKTASKKKSSQSSRTSSNSHRVTRSGALVQAMKEFGDKPFKTEEVIKNSKLIYEQANGVVDKNDRGASAEWMVARGILTALGLIEKVDRITFCYTGEIK